MGHISPVFTPRRARRQFDERVEGRIGIAATPARFRRNEIVSLVAQLLVVNNRNVEPDQVLNDDGDVDLIPAAA